MLAAALIAACLAAALLERRGRLGAEELTRLIFLTGLAARVVFCVCTPTFCAPDEKAHFYYVRHLAAFHAFPVQFPIDTPARLGAEVWEFYQPPLYYAILALPMSLFRSIPSSGLQLRLLRLFSMSVFWIPQFWLVRALGRRLMLDEDHRLAVLAFCALLPSYAFSSSMLNNDTLLAALGALVFYFLSGPESDGEALACGLALSLAFYAKFSAFMLGAPIAAVLGIRLRRGMPPGQALRQAGLMLAPAALLWLPWGLRNLRLYGDLSGVSAGFRAGAVYARARWSSPVQGLERSFFYLLTTFWAVSGRHNQHQFEKVWSYVFTFAGLGGLLAVRRPLLEKMSLGLKDFLVSGALAAVFGVLLALSFGLSHAQAQGRYLFLLLAPISILWTLGLRRLLDGKLPPTPVAGAFAAYLLLFVRFSLNASP